jgi:hypothetical protein
MIAERYFYSFAWGPRRQHRESIGACAADTLRAIAVICPQLSRWRAGGRHVVDVNDQDLERKLSRSLRDSSTGGGDKLPVGEPTIGFQLMLISETQGEGITEFTVLVGSESQWNSNVVSIAIKDITPVTSGLLERPSCIAMIRSIAAIWNPEKGCINSHELLEALDYPPLDKQPAWALYGPQPCPAQLVEFSTRHKLELLDLQGHYLLFACNKITELTSDKCMRILKLMGQLL